jgi:hypothetical protein
MHAQPLLDLDGGGGKGVIGRRGRQHDQVDVVGRHAGGSKRVAGGSLAKRGRGLVIGGDMTLANAGTLDDPLVRRLDDTLEIRVAHDTPRQCGSNTAHD